MYLLTYSLTLHQCYQQMYEYLCTNSSLFFFYKTYYGKHRKAHILIKKAPYSTVELQLFTRSK